MVNTSPHSRPVSIVVFDQVNIIDVTGPVGVWTGTDKMEERPIV